MSPAGPADTTRLPRPVQRSLRPRAVEIVDLHDVPRGGDGAVDVLRIAAALHGTVLETGASGAPARDRRSYVVAATAGRLVHDRVSTRLRLPGRPDLPLGEDPFAALDAVAAASGLSPGGPGAGPADGFVGGLVGAFSYDLARRVERLPTVAAGDRDQAWLDLVVATAVVVVDHADETARLVLRPVGDTRVDVAGIVARLRRAPDVPVPAPPSRPVSDTMDAAGHRAAVGRVLDHIAAGDVFQINVTHRLTCAWDLGALPLYAALRAASPAPHAGLHRCADGSVVVSVSPETFLSVGDGHVTTRPIKGTRPRSDDPAEDRALRDALAASTKDRAENVMVVDMERNDLGRVCVPGTVAVPDLLRVEAHPTVWQLVSTVRGRLAPEVGYGGLLRATFPSGSVTGTPKVRAMQLIDEIEPVRRGWYCGALGYLAPGAASLSVTIRTAVLADGQLDYGTGGGIVADSDPAAEWAETGAKAAAFLSAVNGVRGGSDAADATP